MDDNFRKGFITGMAMNPLYVVAQQGGDSSAECFCTDYIVPDGAISDDGMCVFIEDKED